MDSGLSVKPVARGWLVFGIGMLKAGSQLPRNLIAETKAMVAALQQEDE